MPTRPEIRRDARRTVECSPSTIPSAPVDGGLRAAHAHDLAVRPGEAAAATSQPLQDAVGGITERSET
jgi:hypothetical protein